MTDFKGTKGSWNFNKDDFSVTTKGDYKNPTEVCHVMDNNPYDGVYEEDVANGHIIAAAPELLEALQHIMEMQLRGFIVLGEKATAKATLAINKALGQ